MLEKRRDSINSWEQKQWEFAAKSHKRYSEGLAECKTPKVREFYQQRLTELETQYPLLAKK